MPIRIDYGIAKKLVTRAAAAVATAAGYPVYVTGEPTPQAGNENAVYAVLGQVRFQPRPRRGVDDTPFAQVEMMFHVIAGGVFSANSGVFAAESAASRIAETLELYTDADDATGHRIDLAHVAEIVSEESREGDRTVHVVTVSVRGVVFRSAGDTHTPHDIPPG